jgi:hypothetical protein
MLFNLGPKLHSGEGPPSKSITAMLAPQLLFLKAMMLLCQAKNFWVVMLYI